MHPNARAASAAQGAGPAIGGDYRGNFNSPLLTNAPDPRGEIPVSGAKISPPWHLPPGAAAVRRHRNLARIPIKWSKRERIDGNVLILRPAGLNPTSPHESPVLTPARPPRCAIGLGRSSTAGPRTSGTARRRPENGCNGRAAPDGSRNL